VNLFDRIGGRTLPRGEVEEMRRTILLPAVFALVLASCGGDTEEGKPSGGTTPSASASATVVTGSPTASPTPEYRLDYDFPPWSVVVELFEYDTSEPLGYQVLGKNQQQGATVYDVEYQSSGYTVPAYLVIPDGTGPFPVVLYAHGGGGLRADYFLRDAVALARQGYAGLLIEAPSLREPYLPISTTWDARLDIKAGVQYAVDLRRGMDLLETLPEIDAKRIGFVGHSSGAWEGAYLVGVEDRIDAYVLQSLNGWPCTGSGSKTSCHVLDLYGWESLPPQQALERYLRDTMVLNAAPYVERNEGAALLFQASKTDRFESVPTIRAVFEAASGPKMLRWYTEADAWGGHEFGCDPRPTYFAGCPPDLPALVFQRAWLEENV
jgi:hypothetical protein